MPTEDLGESMATHSCFIPISKNYCSCYFPKKFMQGFEDWWNVVDMKWYDYMKRNEKINYIFLKEKENCRLKVWIICWERNFNIQAYNGSEYVCIRWSGALVWLLCVEQDRIRVLFLKEQEISGSKNNTVIRLYCTGSNVFTSRKGKCCEIRMFNRDE